MPNTTRFVVKLTSVERYLVRKKEHGMLAFLLAVRKGYSVDRALAVAFHLIYGEKKVTC